MGFFKRCRKKVCNELDEESTWSSRGFSNFHLQSISVANLQGQGNFFSRKRSHPMSHLLGCDMGHLLISRKFAPRGPVYPGQIPPGVPATRAGRQYIH